MQSYAVEVDLEDLEPLTPGDIAHLQQSEFNRIGQSIR